MKLDLFELNYGLDTLGQKYQLGFRLKGSKSKNRYLKRFISKLNAIFIDEPFLVENSFLAHL